MEELSSGSGSWATTSTPRVGLDSHGCRRLPVRALAWLFLKYPWLGSGALAGREAASRHGYSPDHSPQMQSVSQACPHVGTSPTQRSVSCPLGAWNSPPRKGRVYTEL